MLIGYARVSKTDGSQSLDLQRDALRAEGVDDAVNLYHDFASGVRDDRPGLDSCLRALRKGDVLVVWKLDRLGRNLAHLVNSVQDLSTRGVGLRVLAGQGAQIDTTTAAGRLVFGIVRALEGPGAAGPSRDGPPRHVGVRVVPRTRDQAGDALPVRRTAGPVARAGQEGPRLLMTRVGPSLRMLPELPCRVQGVSSSKKGTGPCGSRQIYIVTVLSVGFRPLPQTTR